MFINLTIVAQATPPGESGLAVVRISGPDAISVAKKVFPALESRGEIQSHMAVYGILSSVVVDKYGTCISGDPIDEVIALPMLAPRSYTGEDTVEFFCHGGRFIVGNILKACRNAGAKPASAGEFSQQAFLNGKLSLIQTEAVADLIHAENEYAARGALKQLRGGFNTEIEILEEPLLKLLSELEGSLEFVEEEEVAVSLEEVSSILNCAMVHMENLLDLVAAGRILREGIQVVFAGAPNVGKSSLFNAMLVEQKAIVDEEAGTTRDVISGRVFRGKNLFVFHDTAGLREDAGRVEQKGIELTHRKIADADIVLRLSVAENSSDSVVSDNPEKGPIEIVVATKCDLISESQRCSFVQGVVATSSIDGTGIEELWQELESCVRQYKIEQAVGMGVVLNERHKYKIQTGLIELTELENEIEKMKSTGLTNGGEEIIATMLASILSGLGEISGRVFSEQLLETVFRRFCVGK